QLASGGRTRRHLEHDVAQRCGHFHTGAERCLPGRNRQLDVKVLTVHTIERVRLELNLKIKVACRQAAMSGTALTFETNVLAFHDAFRDLYIQRAIAHAHMSFYVEFGYAQRDLA